MRVGGAKISKGRGSASSTQYASYTPGVFTPAGRPYGKQKHSGSKADRMYTKAMKSKV